MSVKVRPADIGNALNGVHIITVGIYSMYYHHSDGRGYYGVTRSNNKATWLSGNQKGACAIFNFAMDQQLLTFKNVHQLYLESQR